MESTRSFHTQKSPFPARRSDWASERMNAMDHSSKASSTERANDRADERMTKRSTRQFHSHSTHCATVRPTIVFRRGHFRACCLLNHLRLSVFSFWSPNFSLTFCFLIKVCELACFQSYRWTSKLKSIILFWGSGKMICWAGLPHTALVAWVYWLLARFQSPACTF